MRRSAFRKGTRPFTRILGLSNDPAQGTAKAQGLLQGLIHGGIGDLFNCLNSQWRVAGNASGDLQGCG